jgi:hypothetical protein
MSYYTVYDKSWQSGKRRLNPSCPFHSGCELVKAQLKIRIRPPPQQRNSCHPILAVDRLPGAGMLLGWQNSRRRGQLRSGHCSTNGARRHAHLRIIANPLRLPHIAPGHYVDLAVVLSKPHWGRDANSGLAKCCQGNIFLILNGWGNLAWHRLHSKMAGRKSRCLATFSRPTLSPLVHNLPAPIAPVPSSVLQA